MDAINLLKILEGDISLIDQVNVHDVDLPDDILIEPRHVRRILKDYLAGKISSENLTRWAMFICSRFEYCVVIDAFDFELADYFEDLFYVIQRLSTPLIDGAVNEERVRQYLSELDKYPQDPI